MYSLFLFMLYLRILFFILRKVFYCILGNTTFFKPEISLFLIVQNLTNHDQ